MIEVVHWNPRRKLVGGRLGKLLRSRRRVNNFGDLLGPLVVDHLRPPQAVGLRTARILAVGSILHLAKDGDIVWGAGVNGKIGANEHSFSRLDVRAVRGPFTRAFLQERGVEAPEVYGDPGLLVSRVFPEFKTQEADRRGVVVVPNLNDGVDRRDSRVLDPTSPLDGCLRVIAKSSLVVGSSLHAIVVAESFGVPARLVRSQNEHRLKYDDYYSGTGRADYVVAGSVDEAIEMGGEVPPSYDASALVAAFPSELWRRKSDS